MKIRNKLAVAFIIPIILLGVLSLVGFLWNSALFNESTEIHTEKVKTTILLKAIDNELSRYTLAYVLLLDPTYSKEYEESVQRQHSLLAAYKKFPLTEEERQYISAAEEQINQSIKVERKLLQENKQHAAVDEKIISLVHQDEELTVKIDDLLDDKLYQAALNQMENTHKKIIANNYLMLVGLTVFLMVSISLAWFFSGYLLRPVHYLQNIIKRLRSGEEVEIKNISQDEIGDLSQAFGELIKENKTHVGEMVQQSWLKENISDVLKTAQTESHLEKMCNTIISKVSELLAAGCGAFYIAEENDTKEKYLSLLGSYGYKKRKQVSNHFKFGESLVGQAALEGKIILLTDVPADYIHISSGLGDRQPCYVIVLPILLEDRTLGVMELALFHEPTEIQQQFLEQLANNLAVVIEAIQSRQKTEIALQKVQEASEELQVQQEELRTTNEELEEKTSVLQKSEEELKTQSEELQAANEELEEKMRSIEQQKQEIEVKNKELQTIRHELEEKAKALTTSGKYKTEFLSNMSHELRTPLNSLLLLSKSFASNADGNLTAEQIEQANIIYKGGKDLLELINDILDLSKVEAGKLNIQIEEAEITDITEDLKRQFDSLTKDKNLVFEVNNLTQLKTIKTDAHRLKQIIRNLISNAIKFTKQGYVRLTLIEADKNTPVTNKNLLAEKCLLFKVTDTGIGIEKEKFQEIFEAFQQAYGNTDRIYGGTGLGLTISRELARLLGGEILLESEIGVGSTFSLIIPIAIHEQAEQIIEVDELVVKDEVLPIPPLPSEKNISPRILLVEDNSIMQEAICNAGKNKNIEIVAVTTGAEAIAQLQSTVFAGLIVDLKLPDMSGLGVLKNAHEKLSVVPPAIIYSEKDLSTEEYVNISRYTNKIVCKSGESSLERLLNECSLFLHAVHKNQLGSNYHAQAVSIHNDILRDKHVLLVDDDMRNVYALSTILQREGMKITVATNGMEALKKLEQETGIDIVIMDVMMPVLDGYETMKRIRQKKQYYHLPIIAVTAKAMPEDKTACLNAGANDYITKPIDDEKLKSMMRVWLSGADRDG